MDRSQNNYADERRQKESWWFSLYKFLENINESAVTESRSVVVSGFGVRVAGSTGNFY